MLIFLSVVISDTKGNLSEIFFIFFVSVLVITVLAQPLWSMWEE